MDLLRRVLIDDGGQDLLEYVLLGATVALAGLVALSTFGAVINAVYTSWETATNGLWYPPAPAS
jgi:Flp pilus assembly pilin Flp